MSELKEILKRKKEQIESRKEESAQAAVEWQRKLDTLMETIRQWMAPLIDDNLVSIETVPISMHEEMLGTYQTVKLIISFIDGQRVTIKPKARFIIGGDGRVDIELGARTVMLIAQDEQPGWFLAERSGGSGANYPFNQDVFEKVISSIFTVN